MSFLGTDGKMRERKSPCENTFTFAEMRGGNRTLWLDREFKLKLTLRFGGFDSSPSSNGCDLWVGHEALVPFDETPEFLDARLSLSTGSPRI
jgi:hypothetical protein